MLNRPDTSLSYLFSGLLILQVLILLFWAAGLPVFSGYEQDFFEGASIMLEEGQWWHPRNLTGQPLWHTPALPYWLAAAGKLLFPFSPLGFRILNILLAIVGFWGFYKVVGQYLDARTAFYSCAILFSCLLFSWRMQLATADSLATLSTGAALFGFYLYLKTNKQGFFWLLYGSLALCLWTNGLVSFLLAIMVMLLYLMFKIKMNTTNLRKIKAGPGIILSLTLGLPWFIWAAWQNNAEGLQLIISTSLSGGKAAMEGAFYFPFIFILLSTLPFGIFLPKAYGNSWKYRHKKDLLLLCVLTLLSTLIIYTLPGKFYPHYLLPAFPFVAVIIGYLFSQLAGRPILKMKLHLEISLLLLLAFLLPAILLYITQWGFGLQRLEMVLFVILLAVLPLGTSACLLFWSNKRTDTGFAMLASAYLIFNALLMELAPSIGQLNDWLKILLA